MTYHIVTSGSVARVCVPVSAAVADQPTVSIGLVIAELRPPFRAQGSGLTDDSLPGLHTTTPPIVKITRRDTIQPYLRVPHGTTHHTSRNNHSASRQQYGLTTTSDCATEPTYLLPSSRSVRGRKLTPHPCISLFARVRLTAAPRGVADRAV